MGMMADLHAESWDFVLQHFQADYLNLHQIKRTPFGTKTFLFAYILFGLFFKNHIQKQGSVNRWVVMSSERARTPSFGILGLNFVCVFFEMFLLFSTCIVGDGLD